MLDLLEKPAAVSRTVRSGIRIRMIPPAATRRAGFEQFAQTSLTRLHSTAYQLCHDWHLAQDLTQTTLTKLFQSWDRACESDNLPAYAQKILLRVYLDHRRRRSSTEVFLGGMREPAYEISPDLRLDLLGALSRLPARDRTIVVLRYFADHSVEQVSAELGVPINVVKSQTRRSLIKLRHMLGTDRRALFA
ncbi:RNA polymerase sigma factor (sigma-70 family) [Actinoplanes lutulentus]|uniref:RNA polymerase sigma (SigV) subunit n=1 Tax=Actinoplanes lutulentus TaxID=1287878 RepID=A0A327ZD30_9ACTN|nr:sigma-70 family RNA polymerase sigma factor [Actinoplanes lutulentus]MBB2948158.1 RNA polymerase sigma factor (sigma-70 family) [Actinoplanes lutulentus]RAK31342.1 RNA polymerase sigma (SigV) subunit [Actinoplanes lutulentus]